MEDIIFNTKEELYKRTIPALRSKIQEAQKNGYDHLRQEDIWNYLQDSKWSKDSNLTLSDIINDIFHVDFEKVHNFFIKVNKDLKRDVKLDDINIK